MNHVRKPKPGHRDGKGFNLAGPHREDSIPDGSQRKPSDAVKQAAHGQLFLYGRSFLPFRLTTYDRSAKIKPVPEGTGRCQ